LYGEQDSSTVGKMASWYFPLRDKSNTGASDFMGMFYPIRNKEKPPG